MSEIGAETAPPGNRSVRMAPGPGSAKAVERKGGEPVAVAFICENCARPAVAPSSGIRRRPTTPDFAWPFSLQEIAVPCAGRLQPEHVLKALEDGADAVAVICCEEGNCHHLEGNRRCARRLDDVGKMIEEIGLGAGRLLLFHLPGSAAEDMALGVSPQAASPPNPDLKRKIAEVRDALLARLQNIPRNPLRAPVP
jgi:F420-non-reducing hydrogenase iron-sulfur subunit